MTIREGIGENLTVGKKVLCVRKAEWWGGLPTIQWCVIERKLGEGPTDEGVGVRFQRMKLVQDVHYTKLHEEEGPARAVFALLVAAHVKDLAGKLKKAKAINPAAHKIPDHTLPRKKKA